MDRTIYVRTPPSAPASSARMMRSLRAFTGLILLAYVTMHLLNLSLGLISLEAMDIAAPYLSGWWTTPQTRPVLLTALGVHYLLGLWAIYTRPSLTGTTEDMVQALSGLLVIPLLATHAIGVMMLKRHYVDVDYEFISRIFWLSNPGIGLTQVLLVSIVWVHGCGGLFVLLRAKRAAASSLSWLYPIAVAVPVVALLGYVQAGRIVLADGIGPQISQSLTPTGQEAPAIPFAGIKSMIDQVIWISGLAGVLILLARWLRRTLSNPAPVKVITDGVGMITSDTAMTLLDGFRAADQPHASLCSGRGRCGTCAVRILSTSKDLPVPTPLEQATLDRIDKGADVRLACQLMPVHGGKITVERVFPPDFAFDGGSRPPMPPASDPKGEVPA